MVSLAAAALAVDATLPARTGEPAITAVVRVLAVNKHAPLAGAPLVSRQSALTVFAAWCGALATAVAANLIVGAGIAAAATVDVADAGIEDPAIAASKGGIVVWVALRTVAAFGARVAATVAAAGPALFAADRDLRGIVEVALDDAELARVVAIALAANEAAVVAVFLSAETRVAWIRTRLAVVVSLSLAFPASPAASFPSV
ncbi:MAG: hypothetical protein U0031_08785 [Thermomicrobiales bacterium]